MKQIDRNELRDMMDYHTDLKLVEVLSREQYEDFHLPGAVNVPIGSEDFDEMIRDVADESEPVVVYCWDMDCNASPRAARRLEDLGFTNVHDYSAGKKDWRDAGLPIS